MNFRRQKQDLDRVKFLDELKRECALRFEPEVAEAVVAEVDAHLTDSIQARLELGDSLTVAEIDAVKSFHEPQKFVQSMGRVHRDEQAHDMPLFLTGLALLSWIGFYIEVAPKHLTWMLGPFGILMLGAAVLVRTAQIGGLRLGTLRRLTVAAVFVIGVIAPLRTVNLWFYGGMGYMPIGMARQMVNDHGGFIRSSLSEGNWATTYVGEIAESTRYDLDPARRALAAPLWERYESNIPQTAPSLIFCLGSLFAAHLIPVAVKKRRKLRRWVRSRA